MSDGKTSCSTCGEAFTCGIGTGSCWCAERPWVLAVPEPEAGAGCLCPRCLDARLAAQPVDPPPGRARIDP